MISRRRFTTGVVIALTPLGSTARAQEYKAQQTEKKQSKDFPDGVLFVERIDEMTDEKLCSVHTAMRGVEAVVSGTSVTFFVHEGRGPVARNPAPTLRLGQSKPIQLIATDRPYVIGVSKDRSREIIAIPNAYGVRSASSFCPRARPRIRSTIWTRASLRRGPR